MAKIGFLVGSFKEGSFNALVADKLMELLPSGFEGEKLEIKQLPFYTEEFDENPPAELTEFRSKLENLDGVIVVSPEYNRSYPGVLKNALDIGSRPYGSSKWTGKPTGVVTVSPGSYGGFAANHHLRQVFTSLNMPVLQQPEMYLGNIHKCLNEDGSIGDKTVEMLQGFVDAYARFFNQLKK